MLGFEPMWNCRSHACSRAELGDFSFLLVANANFAEEMPVLLSRS